MLINLDKYYKHDGKYFDKNYNSESTSYFQLTELEQQVLEAEGRAEEAEDKVTTQKEHFTENKFKKINKFVKSRRQVTADDKVG